MTRDECVARVLSREDVGRFFARFVELTTCAAIAESSRESNEAAKANARRAKDAPLVPVPEKPNEHAVAAEAMRQLAKALGETERASAGS